MGNQTTRALNAEPGRGWFRTCGIRLFTGCGIQFSLDGLQDVRNLFPTILSASNFSDAPLRLIVLLKAKCHLDLSDGFHCRGIDSGETLDLDRIILEFK